jgi:hypothetical protein
MLRLRNHFLMYRKNIVAEATCGRGTTISEDFAPRCTQHFLCNRKFVIIIISKIYFTVNKYKL